MRLAGYARVSTINQKDEGTIDLQLTALDAYAAEFGHELIETFKDEGVSGGLADRPDLAGSLITLTTIQALLMRYLFTSSTG